MPSLSSSTREITNTEATVVPGLLFLELLWTPQVIDLILWDSELLNRKNNMLKRLTRAFFPLQLSVFQDSGKFICNLSLPENYHLAVIKWRNFFWKLTLVNVFCDCSMCFPSSSTSSRVCFSFPLHANAHQFALGKAAASFLICYLLSCLCQFPATAITFIP